MHSARSDDPSLGKGCPPQMVAEEVLAACERWGVRPRGVTDEPLAIVRARAAAKFAPLDSAQLDATDAAIRQVMGAGNALTRRFGDVLALRSAPASRAANSLRPWAARDDAPEREVTGSGGLIPERPPPVP